MNRLRVACASGVRHAGPYLEILGQDSRVELVGLGEEPGVPEWMRTDSRRVAEQARIPWHEDLGEWLDPSRVDLVLICSEPTRHAHLAQQLLERGLSLLVDKPVATSVAQVDQLLATQARVGARCSVINRTHAPALRRLCRWIDAGYLGLPVHFDLEFLADGAHFSTSVERPELVVDRSLSGGGEMMNFLGYCLDAMHYATGLEVEEIFALTGSLFLDSHRRGGVEDAAVVSVQLTHGVNATITLGRVPFAPGLGPTATSMRVLGSHGQAVADDDRPALEHYGPEGLRAESFDGGEEALRAYLDHVVTTALAGQDADYGLAEARRTLAAIEAAYRSVTSGVPERP
ncbi:Gfo/Idh/MocA family oxidoreductase [Scrofimicrobium sp. R131]|uniref:Gfo/Idh/MocA family oxidoreductase n=1 Tax=Scrofimicrobium appendicitidis TaxID=3079930 RepID=A0AAU7VA62_9ACTO